MTMNKRFYPITEIQKLNGFRYVSKNTILNFMSDIDDVVYNGNRTMLKSDWHILMEHLIKTFRIAVFDDELTRLMTCFLFDVMFTIYTDKENPELFRFVPLSETAMYAYATNRTERYKRLFDDETPEYEKQMKQIFVKDMKKFFNDNYKKIARYFNVNRNDVENYTFDDWSELNLKIKRYNDELKRNEKRPLTFFGNDSGDDVRPVGRPKSEHCIQKINKTTMNVECEYQNREDCMNENGIDKMTMSKLLSGKQKAKNGYIYRFK